MAKLKHIVFIFTLVLLGLSSCQKEDFSADANVWDMGEERAAKGDDFYGELDGDMAIDSRGDEFQGDDHSDDGGFQIDSSGDEEDDDHGSINDDDEEDVEDESDDDTINDDDEEDIEDEEDDDEEIDLSVAPDNQSTSARANRVLSNGKKIKK